MSDLDEFLNIAGVAPHPPEEWCWQCKLEMRFVETDDKRYASRTYLCQPCQRLYVITIAEAEAIENMKREMQASRDAQRKRKEVGRRQR